MTPIRGFLKRILPAPEAPPGDRPSSDQERRSSHAAVADSPASDGDRDSTKRRRGRRGGRGRNRSGDSPPTSETQRSTSEGSSATSTSERSPQQRSNDGQSRESNRNGNGKRSGQSGDEREYRWGRRVPDGEAKQLVEQRMEQSQRRRRTNRRVGLDAPLPEDIAFRAAAEGGDRTILPSRRRRPEGLRDTERVITAGPRTLGGWSHWGTTPSLAIPAPLAPPDITIEPEAVKALDAAEVAEDELVPAATDDVTEVTVEADEADEAIAESEVPAVEDAARPRRRGRRGGRGRSRSGETPSTTAGPDDEAELDDDDDIEPDTDEVSVVAPARASVLPRTSPAVVGDFPPAFVALGIDVRNLQAITRLRYEEPTPIQERAIPALLNGLDVVGVAQTGSGKTVAFGVPMMERLDASVDEVQAIVLVPTRELAQQVLEVLDDLGKPWELEAIGLLGGRRLDADFRALKAKPHVVVGTPGRIIDHLNRGTLSLRHVRYAVLDEADQMLDIGFLPDIRRILSRTPKRRQTALFSATMPSSIRRLVWQFMDDPETVTVDPELSTVDTIEQTYLEVAQRDKVRGLRELIERELKGRTLVFSRTKRGVDHLEAQLSRDGVRVGALHGDMDQRRRDRVVQDFREGKLDILIATNVAARGLDIPEITHVVNYDVPQNVEEYVHRIGRTGRAGRSGKAITFVCEWDMQEFDVILREFGEQVQKEELHLYTPGR